jgi:hypothetical protein
MMNAMPPTLSIALLTMNHVQSSDGRQSSRGSYPTKQGTSPLTSINTYKDVKGKLKQVTSKMLLDHLCTVVPFIGEDVLG